MTRAGGAGSASPRRAVRVVPYSDTWPDMFAAARSEIQRAVGVRAVEVRHVGSTSVPGLQAKPRIDIALGVESGAVGAPETEPALAALGYVRVSGSSRFSRALYARRGADSDVNVHLVEHGGPLWQYLTLFRDLLIERPEFAAQYGRFKAELADRFPDDPRAYGNAKGAFLNSTEPVLQSFFSQKGHRIDLKDLAIHPFYDDDGEDEGNGDDGNGDDGDAGGNGPIEVVVPISGISWAGEHDLVAQGGPEQQMTSDGYDPENSDQMNLGPGVVVTVDPNGPPSADRTYLPDTAHGYTSVQLWADSDGNWYITGVP